MFIFLAVEATTKVHLSIDPVAAFAVIVSLASLFVSIVAIRRDRPKVYIRVKRGWELVNPLPGYSENTPYFVVSVANRGVRPVTIGSVGARYLKENGGFIFSDSMIYGSKELTQGKAMDCMVKMSDYEVHEKKEGILGISVSDITDKSYFKPLSPIQKRMVYWFVRKWKAKKFKQSKAKKDKKPKSRHTQAEGNER